MRGFSLVELSIVLVILGLLVGGVLSGQSLIRAAELRSVATDYNKYVAAINSFRDKYFMLPGDLNNATQFWGSNGPVASCAFTASTDQKTCDGNGDGILTHSSCFTGTKRAEPTRAWQHLANAGLIEGTYNGTTDIPLSRLSPAGWYMSTVGIASGYAFIFDGDYGTALRLSLPGFVELPCLQNTILLPGTPGGGVLTAQEAWNIDTKIDDAKPGTGKVRVETQGGINMCTDGTDSTSVASNYLLTSTDKNCGLYFANAVH